MNKRPTLKYIDYFDGKYPSYLKKYIQKIDKINNKDKSDNTEI